jgi:parallel beta-helix repeat protein
MVRLINIWGNDSHAQFGNMSDYDYSVACKSNITTINTGCTGNFQEIAQLYSGNDSHVSIDDFYPYGVCFNTSDTTLAWYYNISAIGATPSGYECIFSIAMYNDSHVWECDHSDATYNVNLQINSTLPPYSGCVDLDNSSTYQGKVINNSDGYWFIQNLSLCQKTYYRADSGLQGAFIVNASVLTLDCNNSLFVGQGAGTGLYANVTDNITISRCNVMNYSIDVGLDRVGNSTISAVTAYNSTYGFLLGRGGLFSSNLFYNITAYGSAYGFVIEGGANIINKSYFHDNSVAGIYLDDSKTNTFTNNTLASNTYGVYVSWDAGSDIFYFNNFTSNTLYHAFSEVNTVRFNTTNGSSCGYNCSRGNYWDDILTLDILDLNGDGFGESGTQYPYNSTFSSKVNINVTDWGPITSKGCTDADSDGFYAQSASPACPGTYRDCVDTNANILPPKDELIPTADTILCNGTYYVTDVAADGLIKSGASNIKMTCNGTIIIGDGTGSAFYLDDERVTVNNCTMHSYDAGIHAVTTNYSSFTNNTAFNMTSYGFRLEGGHDNNLTTNIAYNSSMHGFALGGSQNNTLLNNTAYYASSQCFYVHDSFIYGRSLGNNITNNTAYSCSNGFITQMNSGINSFLNNTAHDNINGFYMESFNNTLVGNTAFNNSGAGFFQASGFGFGARADNNTYIYDHAYNNTDAGFSFTDTGYNRIVSNRASDNGPSDGDGFRFTRGFRNNITLNIAERNSRYGMYFVEQFGSGSVDNNVTNNTVDSNDYGVYLDSVSIGNLFYYNNFLDSVQYHAYAEVAGNFFNTTNGTGCGANCSRGNYWDDILSLDIYDTNSDGFGDDGPDYPYNAANGGNVSTDVQDEGPITNKAPPAPPAAASITIVGPNGTEVTGTRNVMLNITFGTGVACRWANDDISNLASAVWENCTTVKPWILSEAEGNKTVFMEVLAAGGATSNFNDSIWYWFIQDYTPPTAPIVYDSDYGYDIDWWNQNDTLSAYWWNATDDISTIYYKYRILNNSVCYAGDCSWHDAGEASDVTVPSLVLQEGNNYSFQVFAYTSSGLNSTVATSNGTRIDLTKPSAPIINSTTHPNQGTTYTSGDLELNFTSTDALSGIEGYSYLLDEYPGTAPDNNIEDRFWQIIEQSVNDGHEQLLRANATAASPHTYAVFSQLHENFTIGDSVRVRAALAERLSDYDDVMEIKAYLIKVGEGVAISSFNNDGKANSTIAIVSQDIRYSESMASASIYEFNLQMTGNVDDTADDVYVVVTGVTTDSDNRNNLSIAYSNTSIDNSTRAYLVDDADTVAVNTNLLDYAIEVTKQDSGSGWDVDYPGLQDGTYYFHAKAKDRAGNWGDPSHFKVSIDTAGVRVDILSPFNSQVFTTQNVTVQVKVNEQANVTVIAVHPDGSNSTSDWKVFTGTETFNITIENGTNRIYARAVNTANGVVAYSPDVYITLGVPFAGNKTLRVAYGGAAVCSSHIVCADQPPFMKVGIATENDTAFPGGGVVSSDTSRFTIKIFATNPGMSVSAVEEDLADDAFLDRVLPMFGYERDVDAYVIRTEVRYPTAYLEGERTVGTGRYSLVFKNMGTTPDGKTNISVRII